MSKMIIEKSLDGTMEAKNIDNGLRFIIKVPIGSVVLTYSDNILKELKVLFVEDELNISKLLQDAIADYFFSFTIAHNGEEGLEKI